MVIHLSLLAKSVINSNKEAVFSPSLLVCRQHNNQTVFDESACSCLTPQCKVNICAAFRVPSVLHRCRGYFQLPSKYQILFWFLVTPYTAIKCVAQVLWHHGITWIHCLNQVSSWLQSPRGFNVGKTCRCYVNVCVCFVFSVELSFLLRITAMALSSKFTEHDKNASIDGWFSSRLAVSH